MKNQQNIETTIDQFGRLIIPQSVRERCYLKAGTKLEVTPETSGLILLKVIREKPDIENKEGWMVVGSKKKSEKVEYDIPESIAHNRKLRDKKNREG
jgi:AbrB family looped-hinge helix DNA binding protein